MNAGGWTGKRHGPKPKPKKPTAAKPTPTTTQGNLTLPTIYTTTRKRGTRRGNTRGKGVAIGQGDARAQDPVSKRFVSKLTPEVVAKLEKALGSGLSPVDAAPFAGISRASFQAWLAEGRRPGCAPEFREFAEMVEAAVSTWGVGIGAAITKQVQEGDGKLGVDMLERRGLLPGRATRTEIANADGEPFKVMAGVFDLSKLHGLTDEELNVVQMAYVILARVEQNGGGPPDIDGTTRRLE